MLKNYIVIAWRNLWKNKVFSFINIIGLSFSVAFCLLLYFFIRQEQSYDAFHQKKDRLFRLEMTNPYTVDQPPEKKNFFSFITKNDDVSNNVTFPLVVGPDLQNAFPEIKSITRFKDASAHFGKALIRADKQVFRESRVIYTDQNFLSNFSFRLINGNPNTVLSSPGNVVLSETVAKKFFRDQDPIGKTIEFVNDNNHLFTVSGIVKDAPMNSSIQYSMLMPLQADPNYQRNIQERFNQSEHIFMVELADGVSYKQFEQKMDQWVKSYFADFTKENKQLNANNFHWYLRPLPICHYNKSYDWGHYTDAKNMYQLAILAIIILLIACLNYVLLTISNAAARMQEIGVRKVMGAGRKTIVLQFWVETQLIVTIAVSLGVILMRFLLPLFNNAIGSDLNMDNFTWTNIVPSIIGACVIMGLLAGYYPALFMSKMKPASIIKNTKTFRINPTFSKVLVVVQYTACVIFMIAALVINLQMRYINNKDLGFDKEQVLMVENPTFDFDFTKRVKERLYQFAQTQSSISKFSSMNGGLDGAGNTNGFLLNGEQKSRMQLTVDFDYFEMLGLQIVKGRSFSKAIASDTMRSVRAAVVNESLFSMLGKTAKLGEFNEALGETIIGVVKDYHFKSLSNKIEPQDHVLAKNFVMHFMFKVRPGQMQQTLSRIEKKWKSITGNYPFEYTFLDQTISKMYEPQMRWQKTIQASSFFALFIACMGLFGLSAINAANRTKEIGIRKVLGASMRDIVGSLSTNFLLLISLSILIGIPVAWWMMNHWLEDFAYRIQLSWWQFALVATIALLIAFVAVAIQAVKAATANPAESLKEM
ncbi:MAG TPA: ABC transporter permease [Puia sp.]|nr:ABC transporter permease [Puia sp.]